MTKIYGLALWACNQSLNTVDDEPSRETEERKTLLKMENSSQMSFCVTRYSFSIILRANSWACDPDGAFDMANLKAVNYQIN